MLRLSMSRCFRAMAIMAAAVLVVMLSLGDFFCPGIGRAAANADEPAAGKDSKKEVTKPLLVLGDLRFKHLASIYSVAFSPDGKRLASASEDKTVKVWDAESGQEVFTLKDHTDQVTSVAFSPDGKRLATGSWDKTAKVWDAATGKVTCTLRGIPNWSIAWLLAPIANAWPAPARMGRSSSGMQQVAKNS